MKVIAFGASSSTTSINKKLAEYVANNIPNATTKILDLNHYEMPIYSEDREKENGVPKKAVEFYDEFTGADVVVMSFAEHNGTYTSAFKNILDWATRHNREVFQNSKLILLSTSPGPSGAGTVLKQAVNSMKFFGGEDIIGSLSIPNFNENFDSQNNELTNQELKSQLEEILSHL